jgi:hypothetical protein
MRSFPLHKFTIINYIIIVFIVIYALIFTRNILNTYFTNDAPQQLQTDAGGSAKDMYSVKDIMAYASILENNPFGPPLEFKPLDGVKITSRPQASRSELVLYGTVTGPESLSYAIISDKSRPSRARQDLFAHGDEVFVYGTLTKIQNDSVEITQDGNSFTVYLFDINKLQSKSNTRTAAPGSMVRKINEKQYLLDQRKVQQALNNPEQVLSVRRTRPQKQGCFAQDKRTGPCKSRGRNAGDDGTERDENCQS